MADSSGPRGRCVDCGKPTTPGRSGRMRSRCVGCIRTRKEQKFLDHLDRLPPEKRAQVIATAEENRRRNREQRGS